MFSENTVVALQDVSKCYHVYDNPRDRLKQMIKKPLSCYFKNKTKNYYQEFWALQNISLEIKKGETVGIVGRNGAGKSTLLQLICGTLTPTSGSLYVKGRIAALLELGAGFNPEFTGRENVFLYGAVLGLDHEEITHRFAEIERFADIGHFIEQPVKTYSSGMFVRLAFAVAICVDPDILIVDEALAVGDVKFQAKCFRHFEQLVSSGKTIIFVTHSTEQIVRHCSWAVLLENGKILKKDKPKTVENLYLDLLFGAEHADTSKKDKRCQGIKAKACDGNKLSNRKKNKLQDSPNFTESDLAPIEESGNYNPGEYRWGSRDAEITGFKMICQGKPNNGTIRSGNVFNVLMKVFFHRSIHLPIFGLTIKTPDGIVIYGSNSRDFINGPLIRPCHKDNFIIIEFSVAQQLGQGDYFLSLGVVEQIHGELLPLDRRYDVIQIHVLSDRASFGLVDMRMDIKIL